MNPKFKPGQKLIYRETLSLMLDQEIIVDYVEPAGEYSARVMNAQSGIYRIVPLMQLSPANPPKNCGHCHTCGARMLDVLDGEEYCPNCHQYRRYHSHGWSAWAADKDSTDTCPPWAK